jgi:glycosyltransferase involved in cell wall biosynthesis
MHIAVDGSFWGGQERGVAAATRRLWSAYLERASPRDVTIFAPAAQVPAIPRAAHVRIGPLSGGPRILWQHFVLPRLLRKRGVELLHCPCYTMPLSAPCGVVLTVHDLIVWTHPRLAGWRNTLHFRLLVGNSIRRAKAICVPTETVRRAVINRFDVAGGKVFVVPWGVDAGIIPRTGEDAVTAVRYRFGIDEPFVLFCGCIEAKKNVQAAIRTAAEAGVLLLLVGPWIAGSRAELPERSADGRWRYLGHVTAAELSGLYSAATALLLPSFVEGFGLPAVEAMRCGCPVIASTDLALREVCGGAAMHVPPHDANAWATALRVLLSDRALRDDLSLRGRERAAQFTWANAADRFAEALHSAGH